MSKCRNATTAVDSIAFLSMDVAVEDMLLILRRFIKEINLIIKKII